MTGPVLLANAVRHYDWGGHDAIPRLLGREPDGRPYAELWAGAHPSDPSVLLDGDGSPADRLDDYLAARADGMLGPVVAGRHGRLPFLLKLLSARRPLSLQVHPDADRAASQFDAEQHLPTDRRRHPDPFHKPEMVLARSRFAVLCGLREPSEVLSDATRLGIDDPTWARAAGHLADAAGADHGAAPGDAVREALARLLEVRGTPAATALVEAVRAATQQSAGAHHRAVAGLAAAHPHDPGVAVAVLLHHAELQPGDALFVAPGVLHAYLHGEAVEVMAASDNVVRAGLTSKAVDVPGLLQVLDPVPRPLPHVVPVHDGPLRHYRPAAAEFELTTAELAPGRTVALPQREGPRLVLCLRGRARVLAAGRDVLLADGRAAFVGHDHGPVRLAAGADGASLVCAAYPDPAASGEEPRRG